MKLLIPFLLCPILAFADVRVGDEIRARVLVCFRRKTPLPL